MSDGLAEFWGDILSEEPLRIAAAWALLSEEERAAVDAHLRRMTTESGWAEVQRTAAETALAVIAKSGGSANKL